MSDEILESIPLGQRDVLVKALLSEFGARNIAVFGREVHHSCVLPFGLHPNGDRNPSASINLDKLVFSCFVCGGGTLTWWIATCRGETVTKARGWLSSASGMDGTNLRGLLDYFDAIYHPDNRKTVIPSYSTRVLAPWRFIHPYMTERRHIPVETLKKFNVGYDPDRERIVIPHFWKNKLVGWQSRRLANDKTPKYLSSPDFPKRETIYNLQAGPVVVVESPMSVLARAAAYPSIEATFGASVTSNQIQILAHHPKVTLFFDNDEAGWNATAKVAEALMAYTDVRVVENPFEADAADLSDQEFLRLVESAVPWGVWQPPRELIDYAVCAAS